MSLCTRLQFLSNFLSFHSIFISLHSFSVCDVWERETFQSAIIGKRSQRKLLIHFIQLFVAVVVPHLHSHFHSYSSIVFCSIYSLRIRSFFLNYFWCFVCWCWCCDFNVLAHFFFTWNEIYTSVSLYIQVCTPISLVVNEQQFFNDTSFRVPFTEKKNLARARMTLLKCHEYNLLERAQKGTEREKHSKIFWNLMYSMEWKIVCAAFCHWIRVVVFVVVRVWTLGIEVDT